MDWNKLSIPELKDFIDMVDPTIYAKCAEELFNYHSRDENFMATIPVVDLNIGEKYFRNTISNNYLEPS